MLSTLKEEVHQLKFTKKTDHYFPELIKFTSFILPFFLLSSGLIAQQKKDRISLRDSLDHAFDLSDFIIDAKGFVPVPILITEPALGGFGGGLFAVFIKKRPPYVDSVKGRRIVTPIAPDITGAGAAYTANNTWLLAGFRSGTLVKSRIKYIIGGGFANINMSFYRTIAQLGEKEFEFNLKTTPILLQGIKRIRYSHWYAGFKYLFLKTNTKYAGNSVLPPDLFTPKEYSGLVSQLGAILELDNRDNVFTPDNGMKVHFDAMRSDNIFGSNYDFWQLNYYMYTYKSFINTFTLGWRLDAQQSFGDQPFYLKPFINMRGIPIARYQGNTTLLTELELRWDFYHRWSLLAFGGTGKAFNEWNEISDTKWVNSIGTGFRYQIARKFKLRVGVDIAKGPEEFAYYIIFGSNWAK